MSRFHYCAFDLGKFQQSYIFLTVFEWSLTKTLTTAVFGNFQPIISKLYLYNSENVPGRHWTRIVVCGMWYLLAYFWHFCFLTVKLCFHSQHKLRKEMKEKYSSGMKHSTKMSGCNRAPLGKRRNKSKWLIGVQRFRTKQIFFFERMFQSLLVNDKPQWIIYKMTQRQLKLRKKEIPT